MKDSPTPAGFDHYAATYDQALQKGLSASGEGKEYFARGRTLWMRRVLEGLGERPSTILDFGCGTGSATPYIHEILAPKTFVGVDISQKSVEIARQTYKSEKNHFSALTEYKPDGQIDFAFCNGVFHHIPPTERSAALEFVSRSLAPTGLFALWENNPWNPGTRHIMRKIPFDRDAIPLSFLEAQSLLRSSRFKLVRTDFCFFFPRFLSVVRFLEPFLAKFPLGGQYVVLARKRPL